MDPIDNKGLKKFESSMTQSKAAGPPICLVRPPAVESFRFVTTTIALPLGLAYIAAALEAAGRTVCVVDAVANAPSRKTRYYKGCLAGLPLVEIVERIPADAALIGITVVFTHEWPAVAKLVDLIKNRLPGVPVVLGGEHVTSMPEFSLATSKADFIVTGEGEETIVDLVDAIESGRPFAGVDGLGFREGDSIAVNPRRRRRRSVDDIPYPAWHLFDLQAYNKEHLVGGMDTHRLTLPLLATRGCPYQCTFCSSANMWSQRWIPRDPVRVVDEIEHNVRTYGARSFPFQDLTAIVQKKWIVHFCTEILNRGLEVSWQFPSGTRLEAIDSEVADLMRRSGVASIAFAPESGSEQTRRLIKKRMKSPALMAGIQSSADAGLNVAVFLVIGFPHDTSETLRENIDFARSIRQTGVTDMAVGYYFALPGSELFDSLYDAGRIRLDARYFGHILQGGDLIPAISHCQALSPFELTKWKFRLYLTFYATQNLRQPRTSLMHSIWRGMSGIFRKSHDSKLQTVVRTGLTGGWDELRLAPTRGWITRREEAELFRNWDLLFRGIRRALREKGIITSAPADMTAIHKSSVMQILRQSHRTARTLSLSSLLETPPGEAE